MSWGASIGIAFLAGVAACVGAGFVTNLCVGWYHVSSREGASGYLVVFVALLGGVAGFVVGLVAARVTAASAHPGALAGLGAALGSVAGILLVVGGVARLLADVPPEIDGEELWLCVEARLPEGAARPLVEPGAHLTLCSLSGHTVRARVTGALFAEDARLEDGRWVVPGVVEVFTERGGRVLEIATGAGDGAWFGVPLPRHPGKAQTAWSDWLPRPGGAVPGVPITFRFRVQKKSEPIRRETSGPFEIATISSGVHGEPASGLHSSSEFAVTERGRRIALDGARELARAADVVALPGPKPALLVHAPDPQGVGSAYLLVAEESGVRCTLVAPVGPPIVVSEVTNDRARFREAPSPQSRQGWFDRARMPREGIYLVGEDTLLDTHRLASRAFRVSPDATVATSVRPLGLSPDERSIVRFVWLGGSEARPALAAIDTLSGKNDLLPIDRSRMRYTKQDDLDPAWVAHHFSWVRREDGVDRLAERPDFAPLIWHGELDVDTMGRSVYWIHEAGEPTREAMLAFLVSRFGAERLPAAPDAYEKPVKIEGKTLNVAGDASSRYVLVSPAHGEDDGGLVRRVAAAFDAELASGKHDALFTFPAN